jgi:hypothetical protein
MADLSKLKRRSSLGAPPAIEEASQNLSAPEIAPIVTQPHKPKEAKAKVKNEIPPPRLDGRTLRKTNRTIQLGTKVTPEYDERLRAIAQRDGLLIVELLEKSLDAYEKSIL